MATAPKLSEPVVGRGRMIAALSLIGFVVFIVYSSWPGFNEKQHLPVQRRAAANAPSIEERTPLVDLSPWQTALALAGMAVTPEELDCAQDVERLADHEVDQAFASAMREADLQSHAAIGKGASSQEELQLVQAVKDDQRQLDALIRSRAAEADVDIGKAQLGLDSDMLADVRQDLVRVTGDDRWRVQQELAAHEASMKAYDTQGAIRLSRNSIASRNYSNLASRFGGWYEQRARQRMVRAAMDAANAGAAALTKQHDELQEKTRKGASLDAGADKTAKLSVLKDRSLQNQLLALLDDRIDTQRQLAAVYSNWLEQLRLKHRMMLQLILQSLALVAVVVIFGLLIDSALNRFLTRPTLDLRRRRTLRTILKIGVQLSCLLLILLIVFGVPNQMPTILGLTTAGLTLVFQDFIIAFFGWFILMGKSGIRVGDWVEIDGVRGEVSEIGVFRTALLETGNWTVQGHPTGRRVSFINSFAIKGQYFNFSTSGQWMWDEIRIGIPTTGDLYGLVEQIRQAVNREMASTSRVADEEWKRVTHSSGLNQFTSEPAVDLRPNGVGIDIIVRYVTRASERFEIRTRLYECVINLLYKPVAPAIGN
jgi:small-conductance mechanosensitive channel